MSTSRRQHKDEDASATRNRRTRSFKGCTTCRQRRIKCDEKRPRCRVCQASGMLCEGYSKSLVFDLQGQRNKGTSSQFRRPLLTEEQRKRMSHKIASSVAPEQAMWHIAKIDEHCEDVPESQQVHRFMGPFGAFRTGLPTPLSDDSPDFDFLDDSAAGVLALASSEGSVDELDLTEEDLRPSVIEASTRADDTIGKWWSLDTQWTAFEPLGFQESWSASSQFDLLPGSYLSDGLPLHLGCNPLDAPGLNDGAATPKAPTPPATMIPFQDASNVSIPSTINMKTPHDAVFLLRHYSTTILQGLTPYRHSKTPWHILFIPHAKQCLAAITMGERLSHAALCTFFGILSSTAYSVSYITASKQWMDRGAEYKQTARNHARLMLPTAYDVPKVAKYKVILMALLTMIQISTVTRNLDQAECYFLETEKFIRVKGLGLSRRKSRKVRLLHHCYVFERLLHESTFPGSINSQHRLHVRQAIESSGAEIYSWDDLSFKPLDLQNLDQQMMRIKGKEEGENDLHVKYPGVWAATQYPEIFGIPEIYIFLLSAVIRLGRWKEEAFADSTSPGLKEYLLCSKEVENFILRLKEMPEGLTTVCLADPEQEQHSQGLLRTLSAAMQQSLTIYFYRKVYDVDPSILQPHVKSVMECLERNETASGGCGWGTTRLIWPAFIAAQEAQDPELRAKFAAWFQTSAQKSGLTMFDYTRTDVEKTWSTS